MRSTCYLLFVSLFLFTACTEQTPLSGKLQLGSAGDWSPKVYLIQAASLDEVATSFAGQVIDSAAIKTDGSFAFEKLPDAPHPVLLELVVQKKGERFINRRNNEDPQTANYFPIVWKNGLVLKVTAIIEQFQSSFSIKNPSPENAALLKLRDIRQAAFQQFTAESDPTAHDETKLIEEQEALLAFRQPLMAFAQNTKHLLPAMVALRWVSPNNDYERIPEFLFDQCEKWKNSQPGHPWVAQLCQKSQRDNLPVLIGDQLADTPLPMLAGDTTNLNQLLGQRITILDLWASWCAPCRRENRDILVPLWEKYHEQGFQIIGYALDASASTWQKAITKDGADRWPHASHLQGDDAPFLEVLRIQTIPANFLLNANGEVIAKNLHGEELVKFVDNYLQE
jgi:thiol-disulfide isomerase/thioredoxin